MKDYYSEHPDIFNLASPVVNIMPRLSVIYVWVCVYVCMYSTYNVYLCLCTNLYVLKFFLNYLKVHCRHHYTSCLNSSACISWALGVSPLLVYLRDLTLIQWHLVVHSPYSHFSKAPVMTFENCCVLWFSPDHMLQFFVVCLF